MIVRINQLDARRGEAAGGWGQEENDLRRDPACKWPVGTQVIQVLVLDQDERQKVLGLDFRRKQVRKLIVDLCNVLVDDDRALVVRLDGPVTTTELLPVIKYLTDPSGTGRFSMSAFDRLDDTDPRPAQASVRVYLAPDQLAELAADRDVGIDREVRLRVFDVPEDLINPLLDTGGPNDERWSEIIDAARFIVSTTRGGESLVCHLRHASPSDVKARLTDRLLAQV